jgi:pyridoxine 5-phosphate synthase
MIKLGVNVDHVATVRQARGTSYPDVIAAALAAERGGADGITAHLREDRRHIQDADVTALIAAVATKVNLEMAVTPEMVAIACRMRPADACLVPERREELTTEGGLDVAGHTIAVAEAVRCLTEAGIRVSLFVDPDPLQIEAAIDVGAAAVEIHTGAYADSRSAAEREREFSRIRASVLQAHAAGLIVNAGHGLTEENVTPIATMPEIQELNIGHSIVARALFVGIEAATRGMKVKMLAARGGRERELSRKREKEV